MTRILIIKLWALGDILMATPLLMALHALPGGAEITWVADTAYAPLLENHPLLKEVVAIDTGAWRRLLRRGKLFAWLKESRRLHADMAAQRFDVALNFHPEKWWLRILCAAPVRIGLSNEARWGPLTRRLYTKAVPRTPDQRHSTNRYLDAARALGLSGPFDRHMVLRPSADDVTAARAFLESRPEHRPGLPLLILHPGTSKETKCWPPESFSSLCAALSATNTIVLTGSGSEVDLCRSVVAALPPDTPPPIIAAGEFERIGLTVALVSQAQAVVTGDTALLHIASALETPVVGIYGSTRPRDNTPQFGPHVLLYDDAVPCAPCYLDHCPLKGVDHLRCLHTITPARVRGALEGLAHDPPVQRVITP